MNFHSIMSNAIDKIWREEADEQEHFLRVVASKVRGMPDIKPFIEGKAVFVKNQNHLADIIGPEAYREDLDLYDWEGHCPWQTMVIFPIWNVANEIVGLVGFDVKNKLAKMNGEILPNGNHYKYSNKKVFNRSKHLYMPRGMYDKAMSDGYIIVSDGVFDMWSFWAEGYNSACALGSDLSEEVLFMLSFFEHVFLAEDNDRAGRDLFNKLSRARPNVHYLRQDKVKDGDDAFKASWGDHYRNMVRQAVNERRSGVLHVKPNML